MGMSFHFLLFIIWNETVGKCQPTVGSSVWHLFLTTGVTRYQFLLGTLLVLDVCVVCMGPLVFTLKKKQKKKINSWKMLNIPLVYIKNCGTHLI